MTTPEEQHTAAATVDTNVSQDVAMTDSALDENETPDGDSQEKTEREEQAEPKAKQSEGQGDNDAEDTKDNEEADTEAMPKSRKAKNTVESPAPSEGRARRERRQTQHYTYTAESKTKKAIVVPEGKGTPLKEIQCIHDEISKTPASDDTLKGFHMLIWGRVSTKHLKQDLLKFTGFNFQTDAEHDAVLNKLAHWTMFGLKDFAQLLCLETSGTKDVIIDRIFKFLQEPSQAGTKFGAKRKRSISRKRASKPKSAYEVFANEKREEVQEELGDEADDEKVDERLKEMFESLNDEEKKDYEEKFAASKVEKTTAKKKRTKPSSKAAKEGDDSNEAGSDEAEATDGEKQPKKKAKSDSPTNAQIKRAIKDILKEGSLQELSAKKVRIQLAEIFNRDMEYKKPFISETIDRLLAEQE